MSSTEAPSVSAAPLIFCNTTNLSFTDLPNICHMKAFPAVLLLRLAFGPLARLHCRLRLLAGVVLADWTDPSIRR